MAAAYFAGLSDRRVDRDAGGDRRHLDHGLGQTLVMNRRLAAKVASRDRRAYATRTWLAMSLPIFMVEGFYLLLTYTDVMVLQQYRSPDRSPSITRPPRRWRWWRSCISRSPPRPRTSSATYHIAGDREKLRRFCPQAIRWTFWPSLAATLMILGLGRPFLWLFGPQFVDGYHLMFILAVGLLARAAIGPVERLLNMVGEQRACARRLSRRPSRSTSRCASC